MVAKNKPAKKQPGRRTKKRAPYVWELALAIAESIPESERGKAPRDGARNTHHYLYGAPKQD